MQDHSHKLFFLGVTGAMCAVALYGAQVGPNLFAGANVAPAGLLTAGFAGSDQGLVSAAFHAPQAVDNCPIAPISAVQAERDAHSGSGKPGPGLCGQALAGAHTGGPLPPTAALPPS